MPNPVMVVRAEVHGTTGERLGRGCWIWCPGCHSAHRPVIADQDGHVPPGPVWEWDGNLEHPTFSPSLLVHGSVYLHDDGQQCQNWHDDYQEKAHTQGNCHSFIRAGRWEFLGDSGHALAGQAVDMVPLPDWLVTR